MTQYDPIYVKLNCTLQINTRVFIFIKYILR